MMRVMVLLLVLSLLLASCAADMMGEDWQAAQASQEQARAAAEWAHTAQTQAEAAEAIRQAPARAQAETIAFVLLLVVGVGVLAGCGAALVWWSFMRARLVFADKFGLYPVVAGNMPATNLNEPGAQHARIAPHRTPMQVLPPVEVEAIPVIPAPVELDARQLQHIERLLLPAGSDADDGTD